MFGSALRGQPRVDLILKLIRTARPTLSASNFCQMRPKILNSLKIPFLAKVKFNSQASMTKTLIIIIKIKWVFFIFHCVFAGQRELARMRSSDVEKTAFMKGTRVFPFKIQLDDQSLPATFQSRFGRIQYKLVLCASVVRGELYFGGKPFWQETVLDEKILRTNGYLNLSAEPRLCETVLVSRKKDRSFFSKRTLFKVSLVLTKKGYLPGERICGVLIVENPSCEMLQKVQISFVNKVMYYDQRYSKGTLSTLGELENYVDTTEPEIRWDFSIDIPMNLMPTFRREEKALEVFYYLQVMHLFCY